MHGRTREQGFGGTVNLAGIRAVVRAVKAIPVIGNGNVVTPQAAKKMLDETGCAGVSIGRGAFYNLWIFQNTLCYLNGGASVLASRNEWLVSSLAPPKNGGELPPEPAFDERVRVMCRHLDLMIEVFGETAGCMMFRKIAPWHAKRFGPSHEFNKRVVNVASRAQFDETLDAFRRWRAQFLDENGELKPRFRPAPLVASFMQEPGVAPRGQIPVPKGPVEVW